MSLSFPVQHNIPFFFLITESVALVRFDISNTERLLRKISAADRKAFNFDVKCIDWSDYLSNVHIPGLVKHVIK